jgi:ribonuclease BN (tRNA processing enzyme)
MQVQFLGSGDAFGSGGRFQTCILVDGEETRFLLDCGATSLTAMKRASVDPGSIDMALITHLHGDHFGGLPLLVLDAQFSRRTRPLTVTGPPGLAERVRSAMEAFFPGSSTTAQRYPLTFVELPPEEGTALGALTVTPFPVAHASGAPSYALRVACAGKLIVYSGDTEWTERLVDAAADADLFICEAYSFEKRIPYHLDHATLMQHRPRLTCKRLLLTHLGPEMLAHRADAGAECADDGLTLTL